MTGLWFYIAILATNLMHYRLASKKIHRKPTWTYKCLSNNECQRSKDPFPRTKSSWSALYGSVAMCWSVCGPYGGLWPRPESAKLSKMVVKINPHTYKLKLPKVPKPTHRRLKAMTELAFNNVQAECGGADISVGPKQIMIHISVKTSNMTLDWDTSEQYNLNVETLDNRIKVNIVGDTVYGVRHALESFTQLASAVITSDHSHPNCGIYLVSQAAISDKPAFKHRGLLLDTGRHFFTVESIKRTLDGMAASKMNIFHWHVSDSESFPLQCPRVPQLTRFGAFSGQEMYWTQNVTDILEYAQIRGIRVMIEIDGPAHVGKGWDGWTTEEVTGKMILCFRNGKNGHLNLANPSVYGVMRNLYRDIADYLPSPPLLHVGGDGVSIHCWNTSDDITTYMNSKVLSTNLDGFYKLWAGYYDEALKTWDEESMNAGKSKNQPVMLWSSDITHPIRIQKYINKNRFIIELWDRNEPHILNELLRLGFRIVAAPRNYWYLNNGLAGTSKYSTWKRMYMHQPPTHPLMLGGEVCMWTELVNEYTLDMVLWPRAAAVAERLWSNPSSYEPEVAPRLQQHRARLLSRGLHPEPLVSEWCRHNKEMCRGPDSKSQEP